MLISFQRIILQQIPERPSMKQKKSSSEVFREFLNIIYTLRGPNGCPWDKEQTPESLRGNLLEEALECISAVEEGEPAQVREELGDLLLVVAMMVCMYDERRQFTMEDVLTEIMRKIIRRHPHVFDNARDLSVSEVLTQWEEIKKDEKAPEGSRLDHVPKGLAPMERAFQIQKAARKSGFDWDSAEPVWQKLAEEIDEIRDAARSHNDREIEREFGDLLFTAVNLCRLSGVDPSLALHHSNEKFRRRFQEMEKRMKKDGLILEETSLAEMDGYWESIKESE